MAAPRERRHLRVTSARYRRNQDALVGTISVDGHNIAGLEEQEEAARATGEKGSAPAPSGLLFIKRGDGSLAEYGQV